VCDEKTGADTQIPGIVGLDGVSQRWFFAAGMSTGDSASIHGKATLEEYFGRAVRKPWWCPAMRGPNGDVNVTVPIKGIPVKIGVPSGFWRALTESFRYGFAAWRWLRPNEPCHVLRDIEQIRVAAGLDHVDLRTFAVRLIEAIKETMRLHPQLRRWGELRIAALDYLADPPKPADQGLSDLAVTLRNALWRAHHLAWHAPERGLNMVDDVLAQAMQAAAISATQALGIEGSSCVSANLMVPFSQLDSFVPNENWETASRLWEGLDSSKRLVIVAETEGSSHAGFWVPLVKGEGGAVLPGGPTAHVHLEGDVVFKDDLPPLKAFGERVEARWKSFMMESFRQRLFVSIPFRAPNGAGSYIAPAVLNVNADANDLARWRRAFHREWRAVARERVQPFVEIAMSAWLIMMNRSAPEARLDTGSEAWDTLPMVGPQLALGGSSEPDEDDDAF
jgi:hypothetical protein